MKRATALFPFLKLAFSVNCLFAQSQACGYDWLIERQINLDGSWVTKKSEMENAVQKVTSKIGNQISMRGGLTIPVVVHIVWRTVKENISDERILGQIEILNRDFNGENFDLEDVPIEFKPFISQIGIRFCLAAETPDGHATSGITRNKTDIETIGAKEDLYSVAPAWNTDKFMNLWVANTGEFLTGFGTYPALVAAEKQGVVVHSKYFGNNKSTRFNLGRVAVHEVGHFLGLQHTWGDDEACDTDDGVEDTPLQKGAYKGCPAHPQVSCGSKNMFMDFMDYVDDGCMVMFTKGQMARMMATIELFRPSLTTSGISCIKTGQEVLDASFQVYPNPAVDEIIINFKEKTAENGIVSIYNSIGQNIFSLNTVIYNGMKINLPKTATGMYWVRIGNRVEKVALK